MTKLSDSATRALEEYKAQFDAAHADKLVWQQMAFSYLRALHDHMDLDSSGYEAARLVVNDWNKKLKGSEWTFDISLSAVARVNAENESAARQQLGLIEAYDLNHNVENTEVKLTEISLTMGGLAEPPHLFEVDGITVE